MLGCGHFGSRQLIHNSLREQVLAFAKEVGCQAVRESSETLRQVDPNDNDRTDVRINELVLGQAVDVDVSVTDPRSQREEFTTASLASRIPSAIERRERHKWTKYADRVHQAGGSFTPFVLSIYGKWGKAARWLFKLLKSMLANGSGEEKQRQSTVRYWRNRITVAVDKAAIVALGRRHRSNLKTEGIVNSTYNVEPLAAVEGEAQNFHFAEIRSVPSSADIMEA
jgi:hypothetical protein